MSIKARGFWPLTAISAFHSVLALLTITVAAGYMTTQDYSFSKMAVDASALGAFVGVILIFWLGATAAFTTFAACLAIGALFSGNQEEVVALSISSAAFFIMAIWAAWEYGRKWIDRRHSVYIPIVFQFLCILFGGIYILKFLVPQPSV